MKKRILSMLLMTAVVLNTNIETLPSLAKTNGQAQISCEDVQMSEIWEREAYKINANIPKGVIEYNGHAYYIYRCFLVGGSQNKM